MIGFARSWIKARLDGWLQGAMIRHSKDLDFASQVKARERSAAYAMQHMQDAERFTDRYSLLRYAVGQVRSDGLYCEFGVYKAESINVVAAAAPDKIVYGFDSFEGLPEIWRPGFRSGSFAAQSRGLPRVRGNVRLVRGWFSESLPGFLQEHPGPIAFMHVDCDLYSSTRTVLDALDSRMRAGAVVVFDEYFNYPGWEDHEYRAFQECVSRSGVGYQYHAYNRVDEQVACIIK